MPVTIQTVSSSIEDSAGNGLTGKVSIRPTEEFEYDNGAIIIKVGLVTNEHTFTDGSLDSTFTLVPNFGPSVDKYNADKDTGPTYIARYELNDGTSWTELWAVRDSLDNTTIEITEVELVATQIDPNETDSAEALLEEHIQDANPHQQYVLLDDVSVTSAADKIVRAQNNGKISPTFIDPNTTPGVAANVNVDDLNFDEVIGTNVQDVLDDIDNRLDGQFDRPLKNNKKLTGEKVDTTPLDLIFVDPADLLVIGDVGFNARRVIMAGDQIWEWFANVTPGDYGLRFLVDNTLGDLKFRPLLNGTEDPAKEFFFDVAKGKWVFKDELQILTNLIANAIKLSDGGTDYTIADVADIGAGSEVIVGNASFRLRLIGPSYILNNNTIIKSRNNADNGDINLIYADTSDDICIGQTSTRIRVLGSGPVISNNAIIKSRNAADNGDINVIHVDGSDEIVASQSGTRFRVLGPGVIISNGAEVKSRNNAGTGDIDLIGADASDNVQVGSPGAPLNLQTSVRATQNGVDIVLKSDHWTQQAIRTTNIDTNTEGSLVNDTWFRVTQCDMTAPAAFTDKNATFQVSVDALIRAAGVNGMANDMYIAVVVNSNLDPNTAAGAGAPVAITTGNMWFEHLKNSANGNNLMVPCSMDSVVANIGTQLGQPHLFRVWVRSDNWLADAIAGTGGMAIRGSALGSVPLGGIRLSVQGRIL